MMRYFISFAWENKTQEGNGNIEMEVQSGIKSIEDTKAIAKEIKESLNFESVTVLYWKRFEC